MRNLHGRRTIYTDELNIDENNIDAIISDSFAIHEANRNEIQYLFDYEKGKHPILERVKDVRPEINVKACENHAKEITSFKVGYEAGSPITLVQRAKFGLNNTTEPEDDFAISALNEMFSEERKYAKDIQLFNDFKKCGLGYMMALPKKIQRGMSPFDLLVLNPLNTFIIRTNDAYRRKICAVTYSELRNGNKEVVAYTDNFIYQIGYNREQVKDEIVYNRSHIEKKPNIIGRIPIVEFINDVDKMGCFESVLPLMDSLDLLSSDRVNDVSQFVQCLLWFHNCELDDEAREHIADSNGLVVTKSAADGKDAKIAYLTATLNQSEVQTLSDNIYDNILYIAGVPAREKSSGGNTGSAILLSNGWQLAETQAKTMESLYGESLMELMDVVLSIIRNTKGIDERIKAVGLSDIQPKFSRNKTYDLVSRVNALVTLTNAGYDIEKSVALCDVTDDPLQFAIDSKENVDKVRFSNGSFENLAEQSIQPSKVSAAE